MGLIFDLAVSALALVVVGSLALLAWTLAVNGGRAAAERTRQVTAMRQSVTNAEARVRAASERASATLADLSQRANRYATRGAPPDR